MIILKSTHFFLIIYLFYFIFSYERLHWSSLNLASAEHGNSPLFENTGIRFQSNTSIYSVNDFDTSHILCSWKEDDQLCLSVLTLLHGDLSPDAPRCTSKRCYMPSKEAVSWGYKWKQTVETAPQLILKALHDWVIRDHGFLSVFCLWMKYIKLVDKGSHWWIISILVTISWHPWNMQRNLVSYLKHALWNQWEKKYKKYQS